MYREVDPQLHADAFEVISNSTKKPCHPCAEAQLSAFGLAIRVAAGDIPLKEAQKQQAELGDNCWLGPAIVTIGNETRLVCGIGGRVIMTPEITTPKTLTTQTPTTPK